MDNNQIYTALRALESLPKNMQQEVFSKILRKPRKPRKPTFFNFNTYDLFKQKSNNYNTIEKHFRKTLKNKVSKSNSEATIRDKSYEYLNELIDSSNNFQLGDIVLANTSHYPSRPQYSLSMVGFNKEKNKRVLFGFGEYVGSGNVRKNISKHMPNVHKKFIQKLDYTNVVKKLIENNRHLLNVAFDENIKRRINMGKVGIDYEIQKISEEQRNDLFKSYNNYNPKRFTEAMKRVYVTK